MKFSFITESKFCFGIHNVKNNLQAWVPLIAQASKH